MQDLTYHLVDVFTNEPFGGNQLAVFTNPPELSSETMQAIAKELNLSESTFVYPPRDQNNDFHVRIFTPAQELPMAGHPTVGTGFVLAKLGMLGTMDSQKVIVLEEGVGPIQVTINVDSEGNPTIIQMRQPLPQFGDILDRQLMADLFTLSIDDISPNSPAQVVTTGTPFLFVPIQSLEAIGKIKVRLDIWEEHLKGTLAEKLFVFTPETQYETSTVHSRMFAPSLGIREDPATGSASGPLGAYLIKYGIVPSGHIISEQGFEMGRPSFITIDIGFDGINFTDVVIGGETVYMGKGALNLHM